MSNNGGVRVELVVTGSCPICGAELPAEGRKYACGNQAVRPGERRLYPEFSVLCIECEAVLTEIMCPKKNPGDGL